MSINASLIKSLVAATWSKVSIALYRLLQVPLLITTLGVENYGIWLVLYSLPSWLTLANLGFGSVAANEMSIAMAAGNVDQAKKVYSSTFAVLSSLLFLGGLASLLLIPLSSRSSFFSNGALLIDREKAYTIAWLSIAVFVSFFGELSWGRFRAANKTHFAILITSFEPWAELICMYITLKLSTSLSSLAFSVLCSNVIYVLIKHWLSFSVLPVLSFSLQDIDRSKFKNLLKNGIAFQAFPLGNALLLQGSILIIQMVLGPVAVALFATARTLVRTVNQSMDIINQSIWPQVSILFGLNNSQKLIKLHRKAVISTFIIALIGTLFLIFFGKFIYEKWLGASLHLPQQLLMIFLCSIPLNGIWQASSVIHMACNKHEGTAKRFLLCTIASAIACYLFSLYMGIEGAALSTILVDVLMIPYVLNRSLSIIGDNWYNFRKSIFNDLRLIPTLISRSLITSVKARI